MACLIDFLTLPFAAFLAFLSEFRWYRRLRGGKWVYLRIDLGERPMFWHRLESGQSISEAYAASHTVLDTEIYGESN